MLPYSEACERNKDPILAVLRTAFATRHAVLEVGSGTGQHAVYFSSALRQLSWQPTEQRDHLTDLAQRVADSGLANLRAPVELDVTQPHWPALTVDAVFSANTLHIMSWPAVEAMFAGLAKVLVAGSSVCIYGPFNYDGRYTSPSNERFDDWLRARDPQSGIRDLGAVCGLAAEHRLELVADHDLPSNNRLIVFESAA